MFMTAFNSFFQWIIDSEYQYKSTFITTDNQNKSAIVKILDRFGYHLNENNNGEEIWIKGSGNHGEMIRFGQLSVDQLQVTYPMILNDYMKVYDLSYRPK